MNTFESKMETILDRLLLLLMAATMGVATLLMVVILFGILAGIWFGTLPLVP